MTFGGYSGLLRHRHKRCRFFRFLANLFGCLRVPCGVLASSSSVICGWFASTARLLLRAGVLDRGAEDYLVNANAERLLLGLCYLLQGGVNLNSAFNARSTSSWTLPRDIAFA